MAIFKCKMCGGDLNVNENESVTFCEYCGTKQTLPRLDDEKRVQLYDRASFYRRENEFDKAMAVYETILADSREDCEAYWSIVLCRYGIQYVEDPRTHKRIPTINRAQYKSIFDDEDYKNAIKYADGYQRDVYEAEAKAIDDIQKGILAISQKEVPFDVFICYKETDDNGNRTQDSVYAQDIYDALKDKGYKVFFSRITLENKLGLAYEPYIFAALNSAKVMLVVGTSRDNFNAVWVKNEWSRYLGLMKEDKTKNLIPLYKDMSPYHMPDEFEFLQSQDMGKIGYLQDVVHGVEKLIGAKNVSVNPSAGAVPNANIANLIERAFVFLGDGDFANADKYAERVLDMDYKNARAYLCKLMVSLGVRKQEDLPNLKESFFSNQYYAKAIEFADSKLKSELEGYIETINTRNTEAFYQQTCDMLDKADKIDDLPNIAKRFETLGSYKDSKQRIAIIDDKKAEIDNKNKYNLNLRYLDSGIVIFLNLAKKGFEELGDYSDSPQRVIECEQKLEKIIEEKELEEQAKIEREKKSKKIAIKVVAVILSALLIVGIIIQVFV